VHERVQEPEQVPVHDLVVGDQGPLGQSTRPNCVAAHLRPERPERGHGLTTSRGSHRRRSQGVGLGDSQSPTAVPATRRRRSEPSTLTLHSEYAKVPSSTSVPEKRIRSPAGENSNGALAAPESMTDPPASTSTVILPVATSSTRSSVAFPRQAAARAPQAKPIRSPVGDHTGLLTQRSTRCRASEPSAAATTSDPLVV